MSAEIAARPDCAERLSIAREAAAETEALADLLHAAVIRDGDVDDLVVRGVTARIATLAGIVLPAVDDERDPPAEIRFRLFGPDRPHTAAACDGRTGSAS